MCPGPLGALITLQALSCTTQGVLTGAGLQRYTATCNLIGWWLVGVPLALSLIWGLDLDLEAGYVLLMSCCAAMLTSWIGQIILLSRHDWEASIRDSQRLMAEAIEAEDAACSLISAEAASIASSRTGNTKDGHPAHLTTPSLSRSISSSALYYAEQRPRLYSNAHSIVSGYSIASERRSERSYRDTVTDLLSTSPYALQSPHIHTLTFIIPHGTSQRQYVQNMDLGKTEKSMS
jgi:hypothetical protein